MESISLQGGGMPRVRAESSTTTGGSRSNSNLSQVVAAGSVKSNSGQRPWHKYLSCIFLSRNPLEFLWPGNGNRCNGIAAADVVVDVESCSGCEVDFDDDGSGLGGEKNEFDSNVFSRFLRRVNLTDAKMFAQLSYLSMLAYCMPKIKEKKLLNNRGLTYVTSSLEKIESLSMLEKDESVVLTDDGENERVEDSIPRRVRYFIDASVAYDIAASAAAYLHSQTKSILPFRSSKGEEADTVKIDQSFSDGEQEKTSVKEAVETVACIISLENEIKQSLADDLKSVASTPCEWFICDDNVTATRYIVIQGSESLASWQANLLFEPVQFEGLDMLVHRGIYEAAKGIYDQMLPDIRSHMKFHGEKATLRFTGHSLGGSLAMLVNLMLLIRHEVPKSCLLPIVTFGAPFIMCGGDKLLTSLSLPKNHVQAVILHRDLVPRAFSADLPSRAVDLLKAVNGNFRSHPCLRKQNVMYSPMGQLLILQPDPRFSPPHSLLPSGSGLYLVTPETDEPIAEKSLQSAQHAFLNSPHPLEILSGRAAYGTDGTIIRDHDMRSYLKAIRVVIRHELNQINKARNEQRNKYMWPHVSPRSKTTVFSQLTSAASILHREEKLKFFGLMYNGKQSLKRFSRLVASQNMQMFVMLLVPTRLLGLEAYNALSFT